MNYQKLAKNAVSALFALSTVIADAAVSDSMRGPALRDVRLVKEGAPEIKAKVCDFQSAADSRLGENFTWFSIWF